MKNIIVMDIDRCLLDPSARIQHYLAGNLDLYESLWETDTLIPQGLAVYSAFVFNPIYRCVFVTSRREWARESTELQLHRTFNTKTWSLLMRPNGCTKEDKDDAELKPWLLETHGFPLHEIFLAFDDRQAVVNTYRELGIVCYQTAECLDA